MTYNAMRSFSIKAKNVWARVVLLSCLLEPVFAQDYMPPRDQFASVSDVSLRAALNRFSHANSVGRRDEANALRKGETLWKVFVSPQVAQDISLILDSVIAGDFNRLELGAQVTMLLAIEAAVISGQTKYVPTLKKLAHHPNADVRGELSNAARHALSPTPQFSVLYECLLASEERLPTNLLDKKAARVCVEEFSGIVESYCSLTSIEQRSSIEPIVNRVLARYKDSDFQSYYAPRLKNALYLPRKKVPQPNSSTGIRHSTGVASEGSPSNNSSNSISALVKHPLLIWITIVVIAIGLVWLVHKNCK